MQEDDTFRLIPKVKQSEQSLMQIEVLHSQILTLSSLGTSNNSSSSLGGNSYLSSNSFSLQNFANNHSNEFFAN